jgi:hypothetical protein
MLYPPGLLRTVALGDADVALGDHTQGRQIQACGQRIAEKDAIKRRRPWAAMLFL